ncbi:MAG: bifunctional phosphoribosylaminoimidazolecarboxamide formyltransferase/IMP cyclohydrolase PurH [Gemmatimonadales bacterium]|nr:MAG: bifunctional phosphoribosylaminoimidazolecarboxamide formyltransferase/IMP cyclohydrolase PurH [Gemmatimonadales bacterium]
MTTRRRALLSVSDKSGLATFARGLVDRGFEILSTGGTARHLIDEGIAVTPVSEITGHPEIMDGRVKTLHPAIHGPLLARRDVASDLMALTELGYAPIDVVAVNLYPFRETVSRGGVPTSAAMEQVDIGGPTMIRAAAKNHAHLYVVVDPRDYPEVLASLDADGSSKAATTLRRRLAAAVFRHIASYDAAVAVYLDSAPDTDPDAGAGETPPAGGELSPALPPLMLDGFVRHEPLRYGENPDQEAAFYIQADARAGGVAGLTQHHGKALSYNNLLDLDGALLSLAPFALSPHPAVCIVKHTTPCGLAIGDAVAEAYDKALRTDPMSAFGSIIATNREVDTDTAERIAELFVECLVAPAVSEEAMEVLTRKKNLRILTFPRMELDVGEASPGPLRTKAMAAFDVRMASDAHARSAARFLAAHGHHPVGRVVRGVYGGLLAQTPPIPPFFGVVNPDWKVVSERQPDDSEQVDLAFAWAAVFGVKSNAILLASDGATLGIGAGQMSRVDASVVAVRKAADAGLDLAGSALASDAFFPFRDGVDAAAEAGVRAIIQPGGSMRDDEVIEAADEHGMAMIFTGRRLFRH